MKIGVFGSGFGLYGYLPALIVGCGQRVLLPERYRVRLTSRPDVAHLVDQIDWYRDETAILNAADALIVSQRPQDQVDLVERCLPLESIKRLLLEKPLATNPHMAALLLERMSKFQKTIRIAYTFRYTDWGRQLLAGCRTDQLREPIELVWQFRAHHYKTATATWKRKVSMGGGAVRFFGIHLIALLAEMGYANASSSEVVSDQPDEAVSWSATFAGPKRPEFRIRVDTDAEVDSFFVKSDLAAVWLLDPFERVSVNGQFDHRVNCLTELCSEFLQGNDSSLPWYDASVKLWSEVERATASNSHSK